MSSLYKVSTVKGNTSLSLNFSVRHPLTLHPRLRSLKRLSATPGSFRPQISDESLRNSNWHFCAEKDLPEDPFSQHRIPLEDISWSPTARKCPVWRFGADALGEDHGV